MAALFADRPELLRERRSPRRPARLHAGRPRLSLPGLPRARGRDAVHVSRQGDGGGCARSLPPLSREGATPDRARAGADRQAGPGRLFPDRLGPRELLPAGGDPGPGPRLGREQRCLLQPGDHGRRSRRDGAAVRALSLRGAWRVAGHRPGSAERRAPRAGDPARLRALRGRRRGHDRERDHLPRSQRLARDRQGARDPGGGDRPPGAADAPFRVRGPRRHARGAARARRHRQGRPAHAPLRAPLRGDPGPAAAPGPALGRHGARAGTARRGRPARASAHAGAHRHPVGQGGLRRPRDHQGRSARPRYDVGAPGRARDACGRRAS